MDCCIADRQPIEKLAAPGRKRAEIARIRADACAASSLAANCDESGSSNSDSCSDAGSVQSSLAEAMATTETVASLQELVASEDIELLTLQLARPGTDPDTIGDDVAHESALHVAAQQSGQHSVAMLELLLPHG